MLQDFMNMEYRKNYTESKILKLQDFFLNIEGKCSKNPSTNFLMVIKKY